MPWLKHRWSSRLLCSVLIGSTALLAQVPAPSVVLGHRAIGGFYLATDQKAGGNALVASLPIPPEQHLPTNEDLRHLRSIGSPQLSPDSKHVVVTLQDSTADGGKTHLWLLSTMPDEPFRQLTFGSEASSGERAPEFLPDNSAIVFTSRRDGRNTLYRLPLDGGEPEAIKIDRTVPR